MDRDQTQYGSLGFIGIYRETFRLIFTRRRIFSQITLALILPLCFLSLAHSKFTELFFGATLTDTDLRAYRGNDGSGEIQVSYGGHDGISFHFFNVVYFNIVLLFFLLSTFTIVYTIACIYCNKDHSFRKVMNVVEVPKAWERLFITFFWSFAIYLIFSTITILLIIICANFIQLNTVFGDIFLVVVLIRFVVVCLYITIICQIAFTVSILEDDNGWKAIVRGRALEKGKIGASAGCNLVLLVLMVVVDTIFEFFVSIDSGDLGIWLRILIGIAILVVVVFLYLVGLVYQTVIYFVCKSYHKEHIDAPTLAHHLERYSQIKDAQLESNV